MTTRVHGWKSRSTRIVPVPRGIQLHDRAQYADNTDHTISPYLLTFLPIIPSLGLHHSAHRHGSLTRVLIPNRHLYPWRTLIGETCPSNLTISLTRLVRVLGRTRVRGRVQSCESRCPKLEHDTLPIVDDRDTIFLFLFLDAVPFHCSSVYHTTPTYPLTYIVYIHSLVFMYYFSSCFRGIVYRLWRALTVRSVTRRY